MKLFLLPVAVFFAVPCAADSDAAALVARMEARYKSAKTLQATFLEKYFDNGRLVRSESGTAYFRRPGKMCWEYAAPEKNTFLVDGKTAWFYVPADHTVTRVPAKQSSDFRTPLALLAGEMKVSRVCARVQRAAAEKPERDADVMLSCTLRGSDHSKPQHGDRNVGSPPPSEEDLVLFEVDPVSGELARILVHQNAGVQVEFRFANWRFNPELPASLFRFEVPPGVAIVNGEFPAEQHGVE